MSTYMRSTEWRNVMAQLSGKRKSWVNRVKEIPRRARDIGFGYVHGQVWFPSGEVSYYDRLDPEKNYRLFEDKWYELYLDRVMLWFGWTLRIHTFYCGDDDSAAHDHPWWFITIPFRSYWETVVSKDGRRNSRRVQAFLPHFRRSSHTHFVHQPDRPFKTIILTGRVKRNWGFWPEPDIFVPHRDWTNYNREETS